MQKLFAGFFNTSVKGSSFRAQTLEHAMIDNTSHSFEAQQFLTSRNQQLKRELSAGGVHSKQQTLFIQHTLLHGSLCHPDL